MGTPVRFCKTRSEVPLIEVTFAHVRNSFLNSGEAIQSLSVLGTSGQLAISSVTNTGSQALFYVSSGTPPNILYVDVLAVTTFGRQVVRSFELEIVEKRWLI